LKPRKKKPKPQNPVLTPTAKSAGSATPEEAKFQINSSKPSTVISFINQ
jgi:hypothetical protein